MVLGHTDKKQIIRTKIRKLAQNSVVQGNIDLNNLVVKINQEITSKPYLAAVRNISHDISIFLITHKYQAPKELIELQKFIEQEANKANGLAQLPFYFFR